MRRTFVLTLMVLILSAKTFGQTNYKRLIKEADSLYNAKVYSKSNETYQQAFKLEQKNPKHLYNAACSAALAGDNKHAVEFLELAYQNGWTDVDHVKKDSDLNGIHGEKEWSTIVNKMQIKNDSIEANYDKPLQKELLAIFDDDQSIRNQYQNEIRKSGYNSPSVDSLGRIMLYKDSINLTKVIKILDEKGWVGKDKVGVKANQALFLVIQHSELETQEKYLPMMRDAVRKGNASANNLALLEDRVALRQGKKQTYGTQFYRNEKTKAYYVAPLLDPDNVDKRREEVGLEPISNPARSLGIIWNVEEYKKQLPEYEELQKEMLKNRK